MPCLSSCSTWPISAARFNSILSLGTKLSFVPAMSRFRQADDRTIPFSELKPERFDPVRLLDPANPADRRRLDEMRRVFMAEIPMADEFEGPRQTRGNR